MSTATTAGRRPRTDELARLSPLVLLAVAMPWLLEQGLVTTVSRFAPAYEHLVTGRLADAFLYPVVTGSIVLAGLYAVLDPAARRALFLFRRPSRRELLVLAGTVPVTLLLQWLSQFAVIAALGADGGSAPGAGFGIRWLVTFALVGGVFAPLVEEVLFRGLLLGYLVERGVPTLAASGIVVAAFAAIHYYGGAPQIASAAVFGAIAVALRLRYDDLTLPVLFHSTINLLNGMLIVLLL